MTTSKLFKSLALATAVLFIGTTAWTQIGIKAGINVASLSQDPDEANYDDYKAVSILGFQGGLTFELPIAGPLAIQPELLFIQKGGKAEYIINESNKLINTVRYNYVELPVLLKLKLGSTDGEGLGFYILGGPFVGYVLNGKSKQELTVLGQTTVSEQDIDYNDETIQEKRVDWGASFGAGLHFGKLFIDARYNLGVNNLLDEDANNNNDNKPYLRTRGIGLTLGLVL
ncbi:MAG: porin family protein [Saprospiraceae bacterium]|mgnify:CR=1 FL=1|nr:porin family protein [Saprospiraceae bacterium]